MNISTTPFTYVIATSKSLSPTCISLVPSPVTLIIESLSVTVNVTSDESLLSNVPV